MNTRIDIHGTHLAMKSLWLSHRVTVRTEGDVTYYLCPSIAVAVVVASCERVFTPIINPTATEHGMITLRNIHPRLVIILVSCDHHFSLVDF